MFSGSQLTTVDHRVPVFGYRYLGSKQFKHRVKATAWQEEAQTQDSVGGHILCPLGQWSGTQSSLSYVV